MKHILLLALFCCGLLCNCAKDDAKTLPSNASKIVGKWTPKKSTATIKFDDGSTTNADVPISPSDFLEIKQTQTQNGVAEGTFTSETMGAAGHGTWRLENEVELTLVYTSLDNYTLYRFVDEATDKSLIMSANDKLTLLWAEVNDINSKLPKKVVGGSAFDEFSK